MTARFGRNKRRAAREAVARAEAATAAAKKETEFTREWWGKRFREEEAAKGKAQHLLAEICERIVMAFGAESALLPVPPELRMGTRYGTPIRWPVRNVGHDLDGFALADPRHTLYAIQERNYVPLQQLVLKVTESPAYARQLGALIRFVGVHDYLDGGGGTVTERAYFASADCLRKLGLESDFRYFAEEIAHQLLTYQGPERRK